LYEQYTRAWTNFGIGVIDIGVTCP